MRIFLFGVKFPRKASNVDKKWYTAKNHDEAKFQFYLMINHRVNNVSSITSNLGRSINVHFLQGLRRPEVFFSLENTSVESVDQALFRSPFLRNVSLDLGSISLKAVGNPCNAARPNTPHSVFLIDMSLHSLELSCDCGIG